MSTNTSAEKSTSRRRVSVVVVLAQSRSALPVATMSTRSATVPTSQRVRKSGSPTARPISAITRRQRSIANPAGSPFAATLENGGESPEKATRISLADSDPVERARRTRRDRLGERKRRHRDEGEQRNQLAESFGAHVILFREIVRRPGPALERCGCASSCRIGVPHPASVRDLRGSGRRRWRAGPGGRHGRARAVRCDRHAAMTGNATDLLNSRPIATR